MEIPSLSHLNGSLWPVLLDSSAAPLFWPPSRLPAPSAWYGHVAFAHWLVTAIRPRLVVELGTHHGVSFAAFCEAVRRSALPTRCIAVDLWQGDAHAGYYGDAVHDDLAAFTARNYAGFAELRRASFAAALPGVPDGSVDLLHVDGRHRYEDVREDYESWRAKLSPRGVVLFHDVCEIREDFGVHRYWAELTRRTPHFTFHHAHGLGVLAPGTDPPAAVDHLCACRHTEDAETLRARFAACGDRWVAELRAHDQAAGIGELRLHVSRLQAHIDQLGQYTKELEARPGTLALHQAGVADPQTPRL